MSIGAVAAVFALVLGFGFVVQRDYQRAWEYQREFWAALIPGNFGCSWGHDRLG